MNRDEVGLVRAITVKVTCPLYYFLRKSDPFIRRNRPQNEKKYGKPFRVKPALLNQFSSLST